MNKNKTTAVIIVAIALTVFVLAAIWSGLKTSNDSYNTKTAGVVLSQPEVENSEPMDTMEVDDASATMDKATDTMSDPAETTDATSTMVDEAVTEPAVEEAVESATTITDQATEAVSEPVEAVTTQVETVAPVAKEPVADATAAMGAQVHVVTTEGLKYAPLVVKIAVGDTVAWENMSTHDTQSLEGLIPEGAEMWHSMMGENYQRTFTVEGIYVYKCTPHFGAGMGGAIIVGNPVNLDAIKAADVAGAAKRLVKKAIQAAEAN